MYRSIWNLNIFPLMGNPQTFYCLQCPEGGGFEHNKLHSWDEEFEPEVSSLSSWIKCYCLKYGDGFIGK